jgi:ankyrin repeat protein
MMNGAIAAKDGKVQVLGKLLTATNVDDVVLDGIGGWTALHYASCHARIECIKICLHLNANVNVRDLHGGTPLHYASHNHVDVVLLLLDAGAMVDATDKDDRTPLHCAIRYNSDDVAKLLLDRGAKVSNVKLDFFVPEIPSRIGLFVESRTNCRCATVIVIGVHKFRRTIVTGNNDINVLRLIGKHVWASRMDGVWNV